MGLRTNDHEVGELVQRLLGAYAVAGVESPPNYSLWVDQPASGGASRDGARGLNLLYRGRCVVARHRSPGPVVQALLRHLQTHLGPVDPSGVQMRLVTLLSPAGAVLVASGLLGPLAVHERQLARSGLHLVHAEVTTIATGSGEVVIDPLRLDIDRDALATLETRCGPLHKPVPGVEPFPEPGRYPVAAIIVSRVAGALEPISRARTVALTAPLLWPSPGDGRAAIGALVGATEGARLLAAGSLNPEAVVRALPSALGFGGASRIDRRLNRRSAAWVSSRSRPQGL